MTIEEENKLMHDTLFFIAHDYVELSHEKVVWQRDDYMRRARKVLNQIAEARIAERNSRVIKFNEDF